jgi:three-Cys-motif partner protein
MRDEKEISIQPLSATDEQLLVASTSHRYGGPWTEIKLDAVMYFAECYTTALTPVGFDLWFFDAFAGSGEREFTHERGGIFVGEPLHLVTATLAGSTRRALAIEPPFHHFIFNEPDRERNRALQRLKRENPDRDIQILDGDANVVLKRFFGAPQWSASKYQKARAVVFLDPYALQVEWATLETLAKTQAVDVWYLFPLRDVTRQLARSRSGVGPKAPKLDRVLSPRWTELYALPPPEELQQISLFEPTSIDQERNATQQQIEAWFRKQLQTIFAYASEPLPLLTGESRQAFSLFLCVANPSSKAVNLAKHFHKYVMKNFAPGAFRRTFALEASGR